MFLNADPTQLEGATPIKCHWFLNRRQSGLAIPQRAQNALQISATVVRTLLVRGLGETDKGGFDPSNFNFLGLDTNKIDFSGDAWDYPADCTFVYMDP